MKCCGVMKMMLILGLLGFVVGCARKPVGPPSPETLQTRALRPAPGKALVYYYNHRRFLGATQAALDALSSANRQNTYVVWEIEPGKHHLEFSYRSLFVHKFELEITCAADRTYYFFLQSETRYDLPSDDLNRETYEIVAADEQTGRAQVEKFALAGWFKDGVLVPAAATLPNVEPPAKEAAREPTPSKAASVEEPKPVPVPDKNLTVQTHYAALVIGIDQYQNWDVLPTAGNDARAVARVLQENYGFQVQTLLAQQATREGILGTLNALGKTLTAEDKLLIYYAGRGVVKADSQTAYWLPVDAKRDSDAQWIDTATITATLNQFPANQVLMVADSCYSGMLARTPQPKLDNDSERQHYLAEIANKRARVLLTSGAKQPTTAKGDSQLSLFGGAFLDALTHIEQNRFTAEELFANYIRESVAGASAQVPEFGIIRNSGHQGGDFIFQKQPVR